MRSDLRKYSVQLAENIIEANCNMKVLRSKLMNANIIDTISPKLFTTSLESLFKKLDWNEMGININGKFLNHLRFADDIILIAANLDQLQTMMNQLHQESSKISLKMNLSKTKVMTNIDDDAVIKVGDDVIERVDSYIYLGHKLKFRFFIENS